MHCAPLTLAPSGSEAAATLVHSAPGRDSALREFLRPLVAYLDDPAITEICINRPAEVFTEGPGGWRRGFGAILAVGIRPCSGAILVLVFALAQGLFWAGIAATFVMGLGTAITVATIAVLAVSAKDLARRLSSGREAGGTLIMRGIEFGAAGLVLLFGLGLLFGYLAAERVTCI